MSNNTARAVMVDALRRGEDPRAALRFVWACLKWQLYFGAGYHGA